MFNATGTVIIDHLAGGTKIIFIDDKRKHLESVKEIAKSQNISFMGVEYTAASAMHTEPVNEKRADLQYKILEKENKCISDS